MGDARPYWSARARHLTPYVAGEQPKEQVFIKLNTNENPYPPSPRVLPAITGAAGQLALYPDADSTDLCRGIARHHRLRADQVFVGNGSDEVLAFAFTAFFFGEPLAAPDITYSFYPVYAGMYDVGYHPRPVAEDFSIDPASLMQGEHVALANPNAPTSRYLPLEALAALAEHCLAHQRVLLVDEAYANFSPVSAIPLLERFENLLVVRTFSKSHALAGMRCGYALGHPNLIQALRCVKDSFNSYPLDRLAQAAALAAIEDDAYYAQINHNVCRTRDRFTQALRTLGFEVLPSGANFVFARLPGTSGDSLQSRLRSAGILVRRFTTPRIADFLRISIGTDAQMDAVVQALEEILRT